MPTRQGGWGRPSLNIGDDERGPLSNAHQMSATTRPIDPDADPDGVDPEAILATVGEAVYEWTFEDDRIRWGKSAGAVLGIADLGAIATGHAYATLKDPTGADRRHDAIFNSTASDDGEGVAYEVQYTLLPDGRGSARRLIVEDVGRWYADGGDGPARARGVIRIINERHEREQRLAFLSRYDELTGYLDRQHLVATLGEALAQAVQARTSLAFMIVAIDNFRAINEAYGFETADQVFAAAARRIRAQLREGDTIGRYSGNKLGIILMNCSEADMQAAAERFHAATRNGVITAETSAVAVTVSIGGVSLPRYGGTVNEALSRAQESLHRARAVGLGRFVAYSHSPSRQAQRRANTALSSEMVAAIDEDRLKLFFQPVVDVATRAPVFHEGLLRLQRPDGTFVPATEFIELSEQLGLIRLVDKHALARTIQALKDAPQARLSLNISAETVGDGEWLSRLADAAARTPGLGGRLIVEITETAIIRNLEEAAVFVATIHDLGSQVAIDDFGAGFSSFQHLRSLGADMVKIAGQYVRDLPRSGDDQAFVKALIELAGTFGIAIVAEWVEDEETAAMLAKLGVGMMQGNLCGAARPEL